MTLRPLPRPNCHHYQIQTRGFPVCSHVRDDVFVDQHFAVARLQGGEEVGEDLAAHVIGPVVEDGVHVVCACAYGRG